jgi:DNA polymerase-4
VAKTLESRRQPKEPILHVDLDAFYASVEVLKDPSLAGRPVAVGGTGTRGVVMSASYEARALGISSAMPVVRARRLAPDAVFVPPDFPAYQAHSNRFREVLLSCTPLVEPIALDEAFLDVSGAVLLFGSPERIAERIRTEVRRELGLSCSVGVASTKFVAKLASTAAKPDGLLVVRRDEVMEFLQPLPVQALWGAGEKTVEVLSRLGVRTVGELARIPEAVLSRALGEAAARSLAELSRGADDRAVVRYEPPKSVSHEETFGVDLDDDEALLREILALSRRVAARLREDGYRARTIVLKVRLATFSTLTRSRTLPAPTDLAADVYRVAESLYRGLPGARRRIRLVGVQATGLSAAGSEQLALYRDEQWSEVERAVDRIERRFGRGAALPATLLRSRSRPEPTAGTKSADPGKPAGPGPGHGPDHVGA